MTRFDEKNWRGGVKGVVRWKKGGGVVALIGVTVSLTPADKQQVAHIQKNFSSGHHGVLRKEPVSEKIDVGQGRVVPWGQGPLQKCKTE